MIGITLVYMPVAMQSIPKASGVFGHSLGILGFLLMLSTETLYSLRKRARGKAIGRMSTWLQIHIFTGLVGVLMLMTIIIVISGIVGRYIYTAVPRTVDGAEVALRDLEQQIAAADAKLQELGAPRLAFAATPAAGSVALIFGRTLDRWRYDRAVEHALQTTGTAGQTQAQQLKRL